MHGSLFFLHKTNNCLSFLNVVNVNVCAIVLLVLGRHEKKICFRSNGIEKKRSNLGGRKIIFLSKITILLFLKIALSLLRMLLTRHQQNCQYFLDKKSLTDPFKG